MTKFVRNMRGLSMNLVFKDFGVAISMWRQNFKILKSLSAVQSRNSVALSTSRGHNS
jgi:hypothetical protein